MKINCSKTWGMIVTTLLLAGCSHLKVDYEMNSGQTFGAVQGSFSDKSLASFKGYMYYFDRKPDKPSLDWEGARLQSPAPINGASLNGQCWNQVNGGRRTLNFFCGGAAVSPVAPPAGDFAVLADPAVFRFPGMRSKTVAADLTGLYVPAVRLTVNPSGQVTALEWRWWKKTASGWSSPTDAEVSSAIDHAGFEIGRANWEGDPRTDRVRGDLSLRATGAAVPPAQSFTPAVLRISFQDREKYHYGMEWR